MASLKRVLNIAGSDSSGGAGIQADIKACTAFKTYSSTVITNLTAQNTQGVYDISPVSPSFIEAQYNAVMDDIGADCIKTGMLNSEIVIKIVAELLQKHRHIPLVVDPVMVATSGHNLLQPVALKALRTDILPLASLITPNIPEAEVLLDGRVHLSNLEKSAREIKEMFGIPSVLLKGGHLDEPIIHDVLIDENDNAHVYDAVKLDTKHTHGTGCTYASAIAACIANGLDTETAVRKSHSYVQAAIKAAPELGEGNGPLNHVWNIG